MLSASRKKKATVNTILHISLLTIISYLSPFLLCLDTFQQIHLSIANHDFVILFFNFRILTFY